MRICFGRHLRGGASCETPQLEERGEAPLRWVCYAVENQQQEVPRCVSRDASIQEFGVEFIVISI